LLFQIAGCFIATKVWNFQIIPAFQWLTAPRPPAQNTEVSSFLKSQESLPGLHFYKFQIFLTVSSQIN